MVEEVVGKLQPDVTRSLRALLQAGPLRVATACSGSDSSMVCFQELVSQIFPRGQHMHRHVFSCENNKQKQDWIMENFPLVEHVFDDICSLGTGTAWDAKSRSWQFVPVCDLILAGFVCKSVSSENNDRKKFARCVSDATGQTGETFSGLLAYIHRCIPAAVVCENVEGLTKRNCGEEPQIHEVRRCLEDAGYLFHWQVVDSRDFGAPHRRRRVWMFALRKDEHSKGDMEKAAAVLMSLQCPPPSLDVFLSKIPPVGRSASRPLNERERGVVAQALQNAGEDALHKDIIIDIAKSSSRAPWAEGACPCFVPNSRPFRVLQERELSTVEVVEQI